MNAPVSTTVIALDVPGAAGADARSGFDRLLAVARQLGYVTQEPGDTGLALTLTLAPDASVGGAVKRLGTAVGEFNQQCAPAAIRGVAHYGVVFRNEANGQVSYMGSAIRSAQSALRRAPATIGVAGTKDFAAMATGLGALPFVLEAATGVDGFCPIRFAESSVSAAKPGDQLASGDPEFLQFLKKRLAQDLGPFAGALVDNARRSTANSGELIAALGKDIDDGAARTRFELDVAAYVKARLKGR